MKYGRSKANSYFIVYKCINKEIEHPRMAISVGKKLEKPLKETR